MGFISDSCELRKVAADWQHPREKNGRLVPLFRPLAEQQLWWDYGLAFWQRGVGAVHSWKLASASHGWSMPHEAARTEARFRDFAGPRPARRKDYMPFWTKEQATHWQLYEDISEGTPLSPVFATLPELAVWCAANDVSAGLRDMRELRYDNDGWLSLLVKGAEAYEAFIDRLEKGEPLKPLPGVHARRLTPVPR